MDTAAATTIIKLLETLPDQLQENVVDHMRDYIEELRDETKWKESFSRTQDKLITAARQASQEIAAGKARPLDVEKL